MQPTFFMEKHRGAIMYLHLKGVTSFDIHNDVTNALARGRCSFVCHGQNIKQRIKRGRRTPNSILGMGIAVWYFSSHQIITVLSKPRTFRLLLVPEPEKGCGRSTLSYCSDKKAHRLLTRISGVWTKIVLLQRNLGLAPPHRWKMCGDLKEITLKNKNNFYRT